MAIHHLFRHSLFILFACSCGQINNTSSVASYESTVIKKIKVGNSPGSVESGDFNNDKLQDLAVTSETDSSVTILLGDGNGNFTPSAGSPFFAGQIPNDISVFDFNKDGNTDLAFANHERNYLTVLLGNGKGSFVPAAGSPFRVSGIPHVHGIAAGDFNNDGKPDLATDSWGNDQVEIVYGDSIQLFKQLTQFYKTGKRPYQRLRAGDVNNDGIPDIVTTNTESNDVTVLLSDGDRGFKEAPGSPVPCGDAPFALAIGDINGDGNHDLVVLNSPASMAEGKGRNGLTVLTGNGKGNFSIMKGSPFEAGNIPSRVAIGDLNGDNINDFVSSDNGSNRIFIYLVNKNGSPIGSQVVVGNHPKGIAIAFLNADNKADIVICNQPDNEISILISK
jgi:hypothetical protein